MAARFVKFAKLFPKLFKLAGEAGKLRIFRAPPEPAAPRPVQVGGASSSQDIGERAPRTRIELEPRAPYKKKVATYIKVFIIFRNFEILKY